MLDSLLLDKLILAIALHRSSCKSSMHFRLWLDRSSNPDSQSFKYSTMKLCVKVCIRRLLVRSPIKNSTAHQLSQAPSPIMSQSPQHRNLVMDTYNKIVQNGIDNPLELLQSTIDYLTFEKSNVSEISLLYCLQSDYYFEKGQYDEAYKFIIAAAQIDSERKEVLQSLINIHTPQANDNEGNKNNSYSASSNPYEDDEKAHEYCIKLENLYPDDIQSLYVTSHCYSALGLYDNAIHILKRVFSKMDGSADFADEIKKRITTTLIARYSNCPNDSHETIIRYLIELIEWKYNGFQAATLQAYIEEIWKRIEYILNKHMDSVTVNKQNKDLHKMESEWNTILKLLCSIPCSIPLSAHLMNYILDVFMKNNEYKCGVEFFTRLIAEYQTFDGNGLSIHATFDKYDVLYLNRAKLYHVLGAKQKMLNNIEYCNRRLLRNARDMTKTELVNECNVAQYVIQDANEKPIIETSQQIKISEPVADRNQTNEVDTDEKEEEECKEHATTNDSENENKTDETLSQRKASPTLDVKAIDIHTKTPHPPSKVSQTMTHRDVSSEKSDSAWGRFVPVCANHEEASLNQVFEFRDEVVTIGRATSNDVTLKCAVVSSKHCKLIRGIKDGHQAIFLEDTSTNGTWIDQTKLLKKRLRIDDGMEIIFVDAHGSKKRTKKVSYVLHLETEHKDGEESTEQSITNSDSEGETKTQETQDDENNKENRQSIKDSKAETKQNDNNPNHRRKRDGAFHVEMFIYKALRQVHPELEISKTAVRLLNSMAEDAFDRICCEAGRLCQYSNKDTLGAKEIQVATSLVVPCKLAKRAQSKAMVTPYMASEIFDCDSSESDSDSDSSVSIGSAHGVMDKLRNLWLN
eukprot:940779_1